MSSQIISRSYVNVWRGVFIIMNDDDALSDGKKKPLFRILCIVNKKNPLDRKKKTKTKQIILEKLCKRTDFEKKKKYCKLKRS